MEPKICDKFGKLTIVGAPISRNGRYWPCKCDCGGEALVTLTLYRPAWTVTFARWWHQRASSMEVSNG